MPIKARDLTLSTEQLREKYTRRELEETLDLISKYGGVKNYARYYGTPGSGTAPTKDPATMDVFSSEFLGGLVSNIPHSAENVAKGMYEMITSPIDTFESIRDAGPKALLQGIKDRYGSVDAWKRTAHNDPVGLGLELAPMVGIAGRIGSVGARAAGAISAQTAGNINKAMNFVSNPSALLLHTAQANAKLLSKFIGGAGLIMLEFTTGMPIQSLRSMYEVGRLTEKQRRVAGLNFYRNIFGDFEIGDVTNRKDAAKLANGEFPDITTEQILERTPKILDELDQQTPFKLYKEAQRDLGGFQDEARIFGHILQVTDKFQRQIILNQKDIIATVKQDFVRSTIGVDGTPTNIIDSSIGASIKNQVGKYLDDMGLKVEGDWRQAQAPRPDHPVDFTTKLGFSVEGTEGFAQFKAYLNTLMNADLTDPDTFVRFLIGDPDMPEILSINKLKEQFNNAGAPLPQLADNIYNIFRTNVAKIYKGMNDDVLPNVQQRAASLERLLDTQRKMTEITNELASEFKAYRTGMTSKSDALNSWMSAIENDSIKKGFIDDVEHYTGQSLTAPIAGLIARRITPKSLVARGSVVSATQGFARGGLVGGAALGAINPLMLGWLPFTSPKFVGFMLSRLGLRQRFVDYGTALSRAMHQHPIGKTLADNGGYIFSMYTALDHIQRYNTYIESKEQSWEQ